MEPPVFWSVCTVGTWRCITNWHINDSVDDTLRGTLLENKSGPIQLFLPRLEVNVNIIIADVDSFCNVKTQLVDADGASSLRIGIGSPLRAKSSIFVRNASLVAPSSATKSAQSFCSVCKAKARSLVCDAHQLESSREIVWLPRCLYLGLKI